jgi:hypothetical protein
MIWFPGKAPWQQAIFSGMNKVQAFALNVKHRLLGINYKINLPNLSFVLTKLCLI